MKDNPVLYAVCHRYAAWRLVSGRAVQFKDLETACFGTHGAANLFANRGTGEARSRTYGEPHYVGIWTEHWPKGLLVAGRNLYVVDARELANIPPSRIRSPEFKSLSMHIREAEAERVRSRLAALPESAQTLTFSKSTVADLLSRKLLESNGVERVASAEFPSFHAFVDAMTPALDGEDGPIDPDAPTNKVVGTFMHRNAAWAVPAETKRLPLVRARRYPGDPFEAITNDHGRRVLKLRAEFLVPNEPALVLFEVSAK